MFPDERATPHDRHARFHYFSIFRHYNGNIYRLVCLLLLTPLLVLALPALADDARLTVIKRGPGNGMVSPEAFWWPGKEHILPEGTLVTLEAHPDANSAFLEWEGTLPEGVSPRDNPIQVTATGIQSITAVFYREPRTLELQWNASEGMGTTSPPPGRYSFLKGDVVTLWGLPASDSLVPLWNGKQYGPSCQVVLDTDNVIVVSFVPLEECPGKEPQPASSPVIVGETGAPGYFTFLEGGDLFGWFGATCFQGFNWGAGLFRVSHRDAPELPLSQDSTLNFEHIMNGIAADNPRSSFSPRFDPMTIVPVSPHAVDVSWPAAMSHWALDCRMRYVFSEGPYVDTEFSVTPRGNEAKLGYLLFMWATYLDAAVSSEIHFPGRRDGVQGWTTFGAAQESGGYETGNVARDGAPPLSVEPDAYQLNLGVCKDVAYTSPYYYGLARRDSGPVMAYAMMFDETVPTRFSVWNWGKSPQEPAWDWQRVLETPQVNQTTTMRARMRFAPFEKEEDIARYFDSWDARAPLDTVFPTASIPTIPTLASLGSAFQDPLKIARALLQRGKTDLAKRFLESALFEADTAPAACLLLDEQFDVVSRALYWEKMASRFAIRAPVWHHLGMAQLEAGNILGAVETLAKAAALEPANADSVLWQSGALAAAGKVAEARDVLTHGFALNASRTPEADRAWTLAGRWLLSERQWQAAKDVYSETRAFLPDNAWRTIGLGEALAGLGHYDDALTQFKEVLERFPNASHTADQVDTLFNERNDSQGRAAFWKTLLEKHPENEYFQRRLQAAIR